MKNKILILLMVQLYIVPCLAQDFNFHSNSPFGIQIIREDSTRAAQQIMFFDYDMDEDLDLLIVGLDYFDDADPFTWENIHYFIELQENTGDKRNPQFAERVTVFENFPFPLGYFFPAAGDLDDDGKVDFIINALVNFFGSRTPIYASNNGSNGFDVTRLDSMDLQDFLPESFFIPELIDLDFDGDLDLLMSGFDPAFGEEDGADVPIYYYAKNTGTSADPEFLGWFDNPYGLVPNPLVEILTGGDIDNDGDVDLIGPGLLIPPDSINYLYVHLNNPGVNEKPVFNSVLESPFGLPVTFGTTQLMFPNLVDIDGDGDLDLFVFEGSPNGQTLKYYDNNLCNVDNSVDILQNTLTANQSGASYHWFDCDSGEIIPGATNQSYNVTTSGNYAVNITDGSGCTVVSECVSVIISRTEEERISNDISLYPNPSDSKVFILNATQFTFSRMTMTNLFGQVVAEFIMNGKQEVDISFLEPGVYLVGIEINELIIVKKLIVI